MRNQNPRRLFRSRVAIGLLLFTLCTPSLTLGWGAGGHMMVASIAFRRLNPRAAAKANALLAIPINPAAVTAESRDFINAAHWADDLRPFAEFDHLKPFHFVDFPFSTDGTPVPAEALDPDNILKALEDNVNILKTSTDPNAQAQALRLIIHFVGDIHQPLHCATRISSANPTAEGDRGGNLVRLTVSGKHTPLHSYWDNGINSFPKTGPNFAPPPLSEIPAAVQRARRGNPPTNPSIRLDQPTNFKLWADESFALAKSVAYRGITIGGTPNASYNRRALAVANQRVAWGGYRLAALLNSIWP